VADVVVLDVLVENEARTLFVDGVVSEMHLQIVYIFETGRLILAGCESRQALAIHENLQRRNALHQDVDPEVEFQL
jgi:hypothetical protein